MDFTPKRYYTMTSAKKNKRIRVYKAWTKQTTATRKILEGNINQTQGSSASKSHPESKSLTLYFLRLNILYNCRIKSFKLFADLVPHQISVIDKMLFKHQEPKIFI